MNASVTVQAGLAAAYAFDEGSGKTVNDASGNLNNGQIKGGVGWTTSAKHGTAVSLNGSNGYVDLGNTSTTLKQTGSMTWSAWVFLNNQPTDDGQIIAQSDGIAGWQLKVSPDTGRRTFAIGVSGTNNGLTQRYSNTAYTLKTWYHVAGVYNNSTRTLDIYVNGVLDNGLLFGPAVPASQYLPAVNVTIAKRSGRLNTSGYLIDDGYFFPGVIDDLRVYNRALTAAEIQTDMSTAVTVAAPPVIN